MKHVVIIGTGIAGLITARNLSQSGFRVTLIGEGSAASLCAPGINCIKGIFLGEDDLFRRKIAGHHRLWNELNQLQKSTELDLEIKQGIIEPLTDGQDYMSRSDRAFHGRFLGLYGALLHGMGEPFSVEKLHPKYKGVIYHPDDYSFNPQRVLEALLQSFINAGGLHINKRVQCFQSTKTTVRIRLSDETEIEADDLVIAAGAGSISLLERSQINVPGFRLKAGLALKASSQLNHTFKSGTMSGVARGSQLRFGAVDFNLETKTDDALISQLQISHDINSEDEPRYQVQINRLVMALTQITPYYTAPSFMVGVRIEGPRRRPFISRLRETTEKGCVMITGFHKSGWSLSWEASDQVKALIENG